MGLAGFVELGVVVDEQGIGERYRLLSGQGLLDERGRRLWAAAEARWAGYGGARGGGEGDGDLGVDGVARSRGSGF